MAERLTEHKTRKGVTEIVVKPCVDINIVIHKLCLFEDIMEKYGVESVEELGYLLEVFKKMRKQYGKLNQENCKNKQDRDTWKRACELACKELMPYRINMVGGLFTNEELKEKINYFYQQAKKEKK